jgi:GWxTD domain-containing protein
MTLRSILKPGWAPFGVVVSVLMGLWGVPFSVHARNLDVRIDSLRASATDTTRKMRDRVRSLKRAIRMDGTGVSHFELAQLYLSQGDPDAKMDAEFWLKAAIAHDRKNSEFRAAYAKLLWQLNDIELANVQAKKALEIDPNQTCALYYAGRYAAWGMDRNYRTISMGYSKAVEIPFDLRSFGEERLAQAVDHLTRALNVDPGHEQARQLLGLVYHEAGEHDAMIALFKERLGTVQDADSHFFVGLGYQGKGYLKAAYRYYLKGFDLLAEDEQNFIRSAVLAGDNADAQALDGFWTERDPLFLSPLNERLMEHCGRVAYANLRYSDPYEKLKGWDTDKGELYIRYGPPKRRVVQAGEFNRARVEVWRYDEFTLWFKNPIASAWKFEGGRIGRVVIDRKEDFLDRVYELFPDPYAWDRYRPAHQLAQFKGSDGETRVEFYYALPEGRVKSVGQGPGYADVELRKGVFLFDSAWDTVKTTVTGVKRLPRVHLSALQRDYYFVSEQFQVAPGDYYFAVEAENPETHEIGSVRDSIEIRSFSSDSLEISSVLLARRVVPGVVAEDRDDFRILPNPLKRYDSNARGAVYF